MRISALRLSMLMIACALVCLPSAHAADDVTDVTDWKSDSSPFSTPAPGAAGSVHGTADIDPRHAAHLTVTASCTPDGHVTFGVGAANATFDVDTKETLHRQWGGINVFGPNPPDTVWTTEDDSLKVAMKLDGNAPEVREIPVENTGRVQFGSYFADQFAGGMAFWIGLPVNGADYVVRVKLDDPVVKDFVGQCARVEQDARARKAAEEQAERNRQLAECRQTVERGKQICACVANCQYEKLQTAPCWSQGKCASRPDVVQLINRYSENLCQNQCGPDDTYKAMDCKTQKLTDSTCLELLAGH